MSKSNDWDRIERGGEEEEEKEKEDEKRDNQDHCP